MATFGDTRTKFLSRLNRRDCTNTLADGFLQDAIRRIQRIPRIPAMEKSVNVTISDVTYLDDGRLPIFSDYIKLQNLVYNQGTTGEAVLVRRPLHEVLEAVTYGTEGTTSMYARQGSSWILGPTPLSGDVVRVDYWAEFTSISLDADTSILLDIADDLVIFGALSYACDHFNDKRGPRFEERFVQILSDIQAQADDDELSGNAVVQQAVYYPADE